MAKRLYHGHGDLPRSQTAVNARTITRKSTIVTAFGYFDLLETFPAPGCALCSLSLRAVDRYLDSLLYEYVNTRETHAAFRAGRGLCNEHSWQLTQYKGSALGVAILYRATVDEAMKISVGAQTETGGLARLFNSSSGDQLAKRLEPMGACLACDALIRSEKRFVETLSSSIQDEKLQTAYRASAGLCLPHFRQVLRQTDQTGLFIAIQTNIWTRLKAELTEYIDKMDHQRAHEKMGAEADSGQRAIAQMAGLKGVFGLRDEDR